MKNVSLSKLAKSQVSYMPLFVDIPCRSSLTPPELREKLWILPDIEESRSCTVPCPKRNKNVTRVVEETNAFGRKMVVDVLPPGEFQMKERLPPLRKPIQRDTISIVEKDPYVLSCGEGEIGIHWMLNEVYISSASLLKKYPNQRIYINAEHQLVISYISITDDASFYSCHSADGEVLRTFSLVVHRSNRRYEIVEYVNFGMKFGVFVLIMILVISEVLNIDVYSERFRRREALRKFELKQALDADRKEVAELNATRETTVSQETQLDSVVQ